MKFVAFVATIALASLLVVASALRRESAESFSWQTALEREVPLDLLSRREPLVAALRRLAFVAEGVSGRSGAEIRLDEQTIFDRDGVLWMLPDAAGGELQGQPRATFRSALRTVETLGLGLRVDGNLLELEPLSLAGWVSQVVDETRRQSLVAFRPTGDSAVLFPAGPMLVDRRSPLALLESGAPYRRGIGSALEGGWMEALERIDALLASPKEEDRSEGCLALLLLIRNVRAGFPVGTELEREASLPIELARGLRTRAQRLLEDDRNAEARMLGILLSQIGRRSLTFDDLKPLLEHPDPRIGTAVLLGVEGLTGALAGGEAPSLPTRTWDRNPVVRSFKTLAEFAGPLQQPALFVLASRWDPSTASYLVQRLFEDSPPSLHVAEALRAHLHAFPVHNPEIFLGLRQLLQRGDSNLRPTVLAAMGELLPSEESTAFFLEALENADVALEERILSARSLARKPASLRGHDRRRGRPPARDRVLATNELRGLQKILMDAGADIRLRQAAAESLGTWPVSMTDTLLVEILHAGDAVAGAEMLQARLRAVNPTRRPSDAFREALMKRLAKREPQLLPVLLRTALAERWMAPGEAADTLKQHLASRARKPLERSTLSFAEGLDLVRLFGAMPGDERRELETDIGARISRAESISPGARLALVSALLQDGAKAVSAAAADLVTHSIRSERESLRLFALQVAAQMTESEIRPPASVTGLSAAWSTDEERGTQPDPQWVHALVESLTQGDPRTQHARLRTLARFPTQDAADVLARLARDEGTSLSLRVAALELLSQPRWAVFTALPLPEAQRLYDMTSQQDLRRALMKAAVAAGNEESLEFLLKAIREGQPVSPTWLRQLIQAWSADGQTRAAAERVLRALFDSTETVFRVVAAGAIPDVYPGLPEDGRRRLLGSAVGAVMDSDPSVRMRSAASLRSLLRHFEHEQEGRELREILRAEITKAADRVVVKEIEVVNFFFALEDTSLEILVSEGTRDPESEVAMAVVEGLLNLVEEGKGSILRESTSMPDDLAALVRTTGDETLRRFSAEALVRCGSQRAMEVARALAKDAEPESW